MDTIPEIQTTRLISSSQVEGTPVYNLEREKLGTVDSVMIDRESGQVVYAVMAFGGFLGLGEKRHPMTWNTMIYDKQREGYVVSLSREELEGAPNMNAGAYGELADRDYEETVYTHYKAQPYWL
ncbi:MAG: PRC-barrel domain-containing protein [Hyphomonas sp.]|uniref:PRC-barrel domain-containing protein n=1 Tax=Hyphomonas sp. TaxID=87 RepID=UPI0034A08F25